MLALIIISLAGLLQEEVRFPATPYDRVFELEIAADDPSLIDGRGPTVVVEYQVDFSGILHLWTKSELDLFVRVEDPATGRKLAEDDDSGGGQTPYLAVPVEEGDYLVALVAVSGQGESGSCELRAVASPQTVTTRDALGEFQRRLGEVVQHREESDLEAAREGMRSLVRMLADVPEVLLSVSDPVDLDGALLIAEELGSLPVARTLGESMLAICERILPPSHLSIPAVRLNLAATLADMGDLEGALELEQAAVSAFERLLPPEHLDLLTARQNLANTVKEMGDLSGARAVEEHILEMCEKGLPPEHPLYLRGRLNLGVTMMKMGDFSGARYHFETVLALRQKTVDPDDPALWAVRNNLAAVMLGAGDLLGARELFREVLASRERRLPSGHPDILSARGNLASTLAEMGDMPGARALSESVLAGYEQKLDRDHPALQTARLNHAITVYKMGDIPGALELFRSVLASRERTLLPDHPDLLRIKQIIGNAMWDTGDLEGAHDLFQEVAAGFERAHLVEHPDLLVVQQNLAGVMHELGDLEGAKTLKESLLKVRESTLPPEHSYLLLARGSLASTLAEMGDLPDARALIPAQVSGMSRRVLMSLVLAPRQVREIIGSESKRLAGLFFLSRTGDAEMQKLVFELQETMRMAAVEATRALGASQDPEVAALLAEGARVRSELNAFALISEEDKAERVSELARLTRERDRLDGKAGELLRDRGVVMQPAEVEQLVDSMSEGAALLTYRRITHWYQEEEGRLRSGKDHLIAHLLQKGGALTRVDLGPAADIEALVLHWRRALGSPLSARGGAAIDEVPGGEGAEVRAGASLRAGLLDPVLEKLDEGVRRIYVCADDAVFLVPLDALSYGDGRLGDRWSVRNEVSCGRLASPRPPLRSDPVLLALGGVDYDFTADAADTETAGSFKLGSHAFPYLPDTLHEIEAVSRLFGELVGEQAVLLSGNEATKATLLDNVSGKRFLHLATHGWFATEDVNSTEDPERQGASWPRMDFQERVVGMAPMLLCGLVLAGGNHNSSFLDRRRCLLTAEELSVLDLRGCELAVLSACQTNVGIHRAGQGIQSLQAALYAAGVRSSITSLWSVSDAATRRLMELFYTKLWADGLPKADALWEAKRALREEGVPVREWAGWVLTGDSD